MRETEQKNLGALDLLGLKPTPFTESASTYAQLDAGQGTLGPLSRDLSMHLLHLAKTVTAVEVTPQTVNAACQCAAELHKIMKLNWEMKR